MLAIGLDPAHADAFIFYPITFEKKEHISTYFVQPGIESPFRGIGSADLHNRDPREMNLITSGAMPLGDGVLASISGAKIVFDQMVPWQFEPTQQSNLKRTYRRASFVVTRLLANLGVPSSTPILTRFATPISAEKSEKRWLNGLYLDTPEEWDDPYRFFRCDVLAINQI